MTDTLHVKGYRLFDRSKAEVLRRDFRLSEWEEEHLRGCEECQELSAVFTRLCRGKRRLFNNGQVNRISGWYKNLCCGIEEFIIAGTPFPDCRRHKNLPTSWKFVSEENAASETKSA